MIQIKINKLIEIIKEHSPLAVAYSGGMDSGVLLAIAQQATSDVIAVTVDSQFAIKNEIDFAKQFCNRIGIKQYIINIDILNIPDIIKNDSRRCYYCKKHIFTEIKKLAQSFKYNNIAEGSNVSDIDDYRPGKIALNELQIISPLLMAGFSKQDIKDTAKHMGIEIIKHSNACLASRVPYNTTITRQILVMIESSEKILHSLGIDKVRVRYHNDVARIETSESDIEKILNANIKKNLVKELKKIGFKYITIDLEGYRTGSLNETLEK